MAWGIRAVLSVGLVAVLLSATAHASSADRDAVAERASFETFLKSIDIVPSSREAFVERFPSARAWLLEASADEARDTWTRRRALTLLSFFRDGGVRSHLSSQSMSDSAQTREWALYTLAKTFGVPGDAELVDFVIDRIAADPSSDVRLRGVRALRWIDHPAAGAELERLEASAVEPVRKLARHVRSRRLARLKR